MRLYHPKRNIKHYQAAVTVEILAAADYTLLVKRQPTK
jgi:hypothetical protein